MDTTHGDHEREPGCAPRPEAVGLAAFAAAVCLTVLVLLLASLPHRPAVPGLLASGSAAAKACSCRPSALVEGFGLCGSRLL